MVNILDNIHVELSANADEKVAYGAKRYFKEQVKIHGVKTAIVRKIARKYWLEIKKLGKQEIFNLCEDLLKTAYMEEALIVSEWIPKYLNYLQPEDLLTFKRWIFCYLDNWAKCDSFCNHTVGGLLQKYPAAINEVKDWAKSNNRWMRRASAVSLIIPARRGLFLSDVFDICDTLMEDRDDLVQKGYGWLLKEASRVYQKEIFDYIMRNRKMMSRTALRYALEFMPKDLRATAMEKN